MIKDNDKGIQVAINKIKEIVYSVLRKHNLLQSEYHLGKVESILSPISIKCFIDGSTTAVTVPCNPDVTFNVGDEILVIFINRNSNNRFALCKRGV